MYWKSKRAVGGTMTVVCPPKFDTAHSQSLKNRAMTSPTLYPRKEGGKKFFNYH